MSASRSVRSCTNHLVLHTTSEIPNPSKTPPVPLKPKTHHRPRPRGTKPLLRWAGSKKRQYESLRRVFPNEIKRYVEPFAGSASFLFRLGLQHSVANDINTDVIEFYRNVRAQPERFLEFLNSEPRSKSRYLEHRSRFNLLQYGVERSILFYYLNRNCFNGIYRVNKSGQFNVPFAASRVAPYLEERDFRASIRQLCGVDLSNGDFEPFLLRHVRSGDFIFLDPPYYDPEIRIFGEYNVKPFGDHDLERLWKLLDYIDSCGATFLLMYPKNTGSVALADRWNSSTSAVLRTIASNPVHRRAAEELLIRNYVSS